MARKIKKQNVFRDRLIGYARVSTEEQGTDPQIAELRAAGCTEILEEKASGADRSRPVLAKLLREIQPGETLVVVRLDRLARSVSHLLEVIEQLEDIGAAFKSLRDPVETATPQGMFTLQILGAVAQLERALIAERTKAGVLAARAQGRIGGNPGLMAGDPEAIRKMRAGCDATYMEGVKRHMDQWLPVVRQMRPDHAWPDIARVLNNTAGQSEQWSEYRLRRTVTRLVREGIVERRVLDRALPQDNSAKLTRLVAGIKLASPSHGPADIAAQLEGMKERTPRGGTRWHSSSIQHLLRKAENSGLLVRE